MNHLQIAYFLAVAKYKSFSEASRRLFIAQSAISRQIIQLEANLNMKLFVRANRKIELTPAGEVLYRELQKYNDWLDSVVNMARSVLDGQSGFLNIGILHGLDLSPMHLQYFHRFSDAHPSIQMNVKRLTFQEQEQEIHIGALDFMITFAFLMPNLQNLDSMRLLETKNYLVVSETHDLGKIDKLSKSELEKHTFITIDPSVSRLAYINSMNYLKGIDITPVKVLHVPAIEDIMLSVDFGLGYAVSCHESRLRDSVTSRFIDLYEQNGQKGPDVACILVWREDTLNPAVQLCVDYLSDIVVSPT